jgi:hypothetical protein
VETNCPPNAHATPGGENLAEGLAVSLILAKHGCAATLHSREKQSLLSPSKSAVVLFLCFRGDLEEILLLD